MEANMDTPKNVFIKVGDTRIKLNNIKNYGISETRHKSSEPIGEYRRKIWLTDSIINRTCNPTWEEVDAFRVERSYKEHETLDIDDTDTWRKYIDIDALRTEYERVKSIAVQKGNEEKQKIKQKNRFTGFFKNILGDFGKIDEELSQQEVVIKIDEDGIIPDSIIEISENDSAVFYCDLFTKGKLYYDGNVLRCEGSPFDGVRTRIESFQDDSVVGPRTDVIKEKCSQNRIYSNEKDLTESGELSKINYKVPRQKEVVIRYLYITTYQNENFRFTEDTCDIDAILKKLDDNLTV